MSNEDLWASPFTQPVSCRLIRPPSNQAKSLIVALHGMGQNADLMARAIRPLQNEDRAILIPDAPLPFEKMVSGGRRKTGRAWYIYTGDQEAFLASARRSGQWLMEQIQRAKIELGNENLPIHLLGYSQGGYLAAILTFENPRKFSSLISCCSRMKTEIMAADSSPAPIPTLVIHGDKDTSLPIARARESADDLRAKGWQVDFRSFPHAGHKMEAEQWETVDQWLQGLGSA